MVVNDDSLHIYMRVWLLPILCPSAFMLGSVVCFSLVFLVKHSLKILRDELYNPSVLENFKFWVQEINRNCN